MLYAGLRKALCVGLGLVLTANGGLMALGQTPEKPVMTISLGPMERVLSNVGYVMRSAGAGQYSGMAKTVIESYTGGLDEKRPSGALVFFEEDQPIIVGFLPLEDREAFFEPLKIFGPIDDLGDGIFAMSIGPQSIYASEVGKWLFIAQQEEHFSHIIKDPNTVVGVLSDRYDIAVRMNVAALPESLRDMLSSQLQSGFDAGMAQQASAATPEEKAMQEKMAKLQLEAMQRMLTETENVVFGWAIDQQGKKTHMDLGVDFVLGSKSDKDVVAMKSLTSQFVGFEQFEAAANLRYTTRVSPEDADSYTATIKGMFDQALKQALEGADGKPAGVEFLKKFSDAQLELISSTLKEGVLDAGMVARTENGLQLISAARVADGNKVAASLQKLYGELGSAPNAPKIKFNTGKHLDVTLHTGEMPLPPEAPSDLKSLFGDKISLVVGTANKAVYFGLGKDCENGLKQFLDANSKAKPSGDFEPGTMHVDLIPILKMVQQSKPNALVDLMLNKLQENPSSDSVMLDSKLAPHGLVFRLTIEEGVLKGIGTSAQAGGNGPGF